MKKGFRKTLALSKHVKLTITHKGPTLSMGSRAARLSINKDGVRMRAGVPGTSIEYTKSKSFKKGSLLKKAAYISAILIVILAGIWAYLEYNGEGYLISDRLPFIYDSVDLTADEQQEFDHIFGYIQGDSREWVKAKVAYLLKDAIALREAREAEEDYEMSDEEYLLYERISTLLDKETQRQFGLREQFDDDIDESLDYGLDILDNLKKILTPKDYKNLVALRNSYFEAIDSGEYTYEIEDDLKAILEKYPERLDADIVFLNLIDEKHQQNIGILKFGATRAVHYQNPKENGLEPLDKKEQKQLFKIWDTTIKVLPEYLFSGFDYFKIGGDGEGGTLAYVIPSDLHGEKWCMAIDDKDFVPNDGFYPYTVVHEMLHYLTLNNEEVRYLIGEEQEQSFPSSVYWDGLCVGREGSYIQSFYEKFWRHITPVRNANSDSPYFYTRHMDDFITEYASTNCAEDMAETFSAWVFMEHAPTDNIQVKFDFFATYPELVKIKEDILARVAASGIKISPTIE